MLIIYKKIFLCNLLIFSTALYAADNFDKSNEKNLLAIENVIEKNESFELVEKTHIEPILNDDLKEDHAELLEQSSQAQAFLDQAKHISEEVVKPIFASDSITECKNTLMDLTENEVIALRINKIGLGSAIFAATCILASNACTKPGVIRSSFVFKKALGLGSAYLIYKLVATNEVVKKDIVKALSKFKKNTSR